MIRAASIALRTAPALALLLAASACAPDPVTLELGFPTPSAFVRSRLVRIRVFSSADDLGACPDLLNGLPSSRFDSPPILDTGAVDVCTIRSGYRMPDVGEGPHAYLVEVRDETTLVLQGCSVGEVYGGAGTIEVALHPTAAFDPTPVAQTPDQRCAAGSM